MKRATKPLLALVGAALLVLLGATPASADHFSGMEGTERCERGVMSQGGPPTTLWTTSWTQFQFRGSLTLVCYFEVPAFVPGCWECGSDDDLDDWTAPTRPVLARENHCYPPGTIVGTMSPGGHDARRADRTLTVFYQTHGVMTCYWADDPTDEPGYWG